MCRVVFAADFKIPQYLIIPSDIVNTIALKSLKSLCSQNSTFTLESGKVGFMLLDHLEGILNYCRTKIRFGVVEAINGNIKALLRRGRGYKNLAYLLLKAQRMAVTKTEFIVLQKAA
jgi:hypothetical protein